MQNEIDLMKNKWGWKMFDLNPEDLWMGGSEPKRRRVVYRPRQKQYSADDYVRGTIKGIKSAYGGAKIVYRGAKTTYRGAKKTYGTVSGFVSKVGKPKIKL